MMATTSEKQHFAAVNGALGAYDAGTTCKAMDADPGHGTSDYAESVAVMAKRSVRG